MVKTALKRAISDEEEQPSPSRRKKPRKKTVAQDTGNVTSEDIVKEFLKLTAVKQTRLKGFKQFLTTMKNADERQEIVLKYLQSRPDCPELFEVLSESVEQRSLFEVQIILEILEMIILQLAEDSIKTKSKATVIVSRLLTNHRKLVYNCLNSASPSNVTMAALRLLTAIVMHGPALARELLTSFDFSHKTFGALVNRRDKKDVIDVRTCFIKFILSFFVTGDPPLIQQLLQIKGFATSMLKNLYKDSAEVVHLLLSTLLTKVVQNRSILRKTKILLFTSYSLSQLAKLYTYQDDSSIRERIHEFLLILCASPHGIAFENALGIFSVGSNNPVLLRFLHSLPKALDDDLLIELIIRILRNAPDLITPYLSGYQMALDPRNSQQWLNNVVFLMKLYFHLPMPGSLFNTDLAISPENINESRLLTIACPENIKRSVLTRGLQHSDAVVQGTTLSMMLVILRRSCNMLQSGSIDYRILTSFRGSILKLLPNFQILISIRENLGNRTRKARDDVGKSDKDLPPQLSIKDACILLSRTLGSMSLFQFILPNCFIQSNYDPWKLLPRSSEEKPLYSLSSKYSMLRIFLKCPARHFKWHSQSKTDTSAYFKSILQLYCFEKESGIINMAKELLQKFLIETGVCQSNENEVSIWLENVFDDSIDDRDVLINFLEKVYCRLASDPFDLIDDVLESIHSVATASPSHLTVDESRRAMPFTPMVPCALKLFNGFVKDNEGLSEGTSSLDILSRYLNLVLLNILERQPDARPLANMILRILSQDDMMLYPLHTRLLLDYIKHWSSGENRGHLQETNARESFAKIKNSQKQEETNEMLCLPPRQFKKHISSSEDFDLAFAAKYLKCNPVSFLECENSTEFLKVLDGLPCCLTVRQLLMFLFKFGMCKTTISKDSAFWNTFKVLLDSIQSTVKRESVESWEKTVSAILHVVASLVDMSHGSFENQTAVQEILRTITEVLKTIFDKIRQLSSSKMDLDVCDDVTEVINDDVTNNDVTNDVTNNDVTNNDVVHDDVTKNVDDDVTADDVIKDAGDNVIHEDVIGIIDKTFEVNCPDKSVENRRELMAKFMKMVFENDVFKHLFYYYVDLNEEERRNGGLCDISRILSDCVGDLMKHCQEEILTQKNCKYLKQYFDRITQAVKNEALDRQSVDKKLIYDVSSTELLKVFHRLFPAQALSEILQAYLATRKEEFIDEHDKSGLGETALNGLLQVIECLLDTEQADFGGSLSAEVWNGIVPLLISIDSERSDDIIALVITKYSELPGEVFSTVLNHCLCKPTSVRIRTAVLVVCQKPELLGTLEEWLANCVDGRTPKKKTRQKEVKFLDSESEWSIFLPLLLFYLSTVQKDQLPSEQSENCLKYICEVSCSKLREWLLETKIVYLSRDCLRILCILLKDHEIDKDFMQNLFTEAVVKEKFLKLNLQQLEATERILQYILEEAPSEKDKETYRTIFVYACMTRLTGAMKNQKDNDGRSRMRMLHYLKSYGQESLRFKRIQRFSTEDFVSVTNRFMKSALRFCFTCSQTLCVLNILVRTIYESCSSELLLPLTDLYQFILNHSKFLEIFLGNVDISCEDQHKEVLIDLLQTVVDLEPKCCEPSHLFLILGAYSGKLSQSDQRLLRLLFTYEVNLGDLALGSRVLWGEAAIEAYQAVKSGPATLWHETNITQILDLLDSKLLLQSAKHFPQHKPLQPGQCEDFGLNSKYYDPSFVLPIFSFFLAPDCEVNCRRFIESSALAYTISALTSDEKEMRQVAYQILSRFQHHLSAARFREKQQVSHLLHYFQNGITEADCRISSLIASFMARALHIFFYPEDPLYPSVNSYMLQKAFMDLRDVPLFLSHLNNSDLTYRTERVWLLHLILDGLRDPMDYYICKKFHVFQQLLALYNSSIADRNLQKLILKIVHEVSRHHAPAYDLCQNYGLVPWLRLLLNTNSNVSENFRQVVDILNSLWFTLIGQDKSHGEESKIDDGTTQRPSIPKNVCSELLFVLSSVLHSKMRFEVWNAEIFTSFVHLLASLLDHLQRWPTSAKVMLTKQHCLILFQIWRHLFARIDIYSKLRVMMKTDLSVSKSKLHSESLLQSMKYILQILSYSDGEMCTMDTEDSQQVYLVLARQDVMRFNGFLQQKLRNALQTFMTVFDFNLRTKDRLDLLFLKRVVFLGLG